MVAAENGFIEEGRGAKPQTPRRCFGDHSPRCADRHSTRRTRNLVGTESTCNIRISNLFRSRNREPRLFLCAGGFSGKPRCDTYAGPVRARPTDRFLGLDLSLQFLPMYRSQVQAWRRTGAQFSLIVYDMLPILSPEFFNLRDRVLLSALVGISSLEADQAICISRKVSRDVQERLRADGLGTGPDIRCLQLSGDIPRVATDDGHVPEDVPDFSMRMRFRPTALMVGTIEPRKGYDVALRAFEHLWATRGAEAPDLVIVGKPRMEDRGIAAAHPIAPGAGQATSLARPGERRRVCCVSSMIQVVWVADGVALRKASACHCWRRAMPSASRAGPRSRSFSRQNLPECDSSRTMRRKARSVDS